MCKNGGYLGRYALTRARNNCVMCSVQILKKFSTASETEQIIHGHNFLESV